jgi:hypothetical protein
MWVTLISFLQPMLRIMHINLSQLPACPGGVLFTHKDKFTVYLESILEKSVENTAEASLQRLPSLLLGGHGTSHHTRNLP